MKKIFQILISATFLICIYSCSDTGQKETTQSGTRNASTKKLEDSLFAAFATDCDYYVDSSEAALMIDKYEKNFEPDKYGLVKEFWIEKCVLTGISEYFRAHPRADGVRFFFGAGQKSYESPFIPKLQVVMTTPAKPQSQLEKHLNEFGVTIPLTNCTPSAIDINLPINRAYEMIDTFGYKFRGEGSLGQRYPARRDPLSLGVWIARCKIDSLMKLFNSTSSLDGLMAISASYYKEDSRYQVGYRKYIVQSTLVFVPTIGGVKNWDIVKPPPSKSGGGLNHGELCPDICN